MKAAAVFVFIGVVVAGAAQGQSLPRPDGPVNDFADVLGPSARSHLESVLSSLEDETSAEVAVVTIRSLDGIGIEEYATGLFREWGVGQAALDNGVLVLVAPSERVMRIEVGYGLEPVLPDGLASAIIREDFLPNFRDGNFEAGILRGVGRVADIVRRKHILTPAERAALESSDKPSLFGWLLFGTFGLLWLGGVGMSGLLFGEAAKLRLGPQLLFSLFAVGIFAGLPIAFFSRSAFVIVPTALAVGVWAFKRRSPPLAYRSGGSARKGWTWSTAGSSASDSSGPSSSGSNSSFGGGSSGGGGASGRW
jgi:uncharacterized protein